MSSQVELAVLTFIQAWCEPDPAVRTRLLEACFAADGRFVTRARVFQGRAALLEEMARVRADPQLVDIRVTSVIDARGTTFRYRGIAEMRDGRLLEALDVGEIDADGRICTVLTFAGPLGDADAKPPTPASANT